MEKQVETRLKGSKQQSFKFGLGGGGGRGGWEKNKQGMVAFIGEVRVHGLWKSRVKLA